MSDYRQCGREDKDNDLRTGRGRRRLCDEEDRRLYQYPQQRVVEHATESRYSGSSGPSSSHGDRAFREVASRTVTHTSISQIEYDRASTSYYAASAPTISRNNFDRTSSAQYVERRSSHNEHTRSNEPCTGMSPPSTKIEI